MYFQAKNTLKNNYYHTFKHLPPCKVSSQWAVLETVFFFLPSQF